MKSEVKNLVHRTSHLESSQTDGEAKIGQMEKDLNEQRLIAGQLEAKMKSTAETMQEIEAKKRQLEEHVSIWQFKYFKMKLLVVEIFHNFCIAIIKMYYS